MSVQDLSIVCFMWDGAKASKSWMLKSQRRPGWNDVSLNIEYVNRLYRGVTRNLSTPHRFFCFTDQMTERNRFEDGINLKELNPPSWMGCLPKLCAMNPENGLTGRIVVMDLDTIIVGALDELFSFQGKIATRSTFRGSKLSGGDLVMFNASEAGWVKPYFLWEGFKSSPKVIERQTEGRERFVYRKYFADEIEYVQDMYPGHMVSYKRHVKLHKGVPTNARIVSCHGNPRPDQIKEDWVKENWI